MYDGGELGEGIACMGMKCAEPCGWISGEVEGTPRALGGSTYEILEKIDEFRTQRLSVL